MLLDSHMLLLLILSVITRHSILVAGDEPAPEPSSDEQSKVYPVDEDKYNEYKEHCQNVPAFGGDAENFTWSDKMAPEEIYELAFVNMGYGLTADAIAHLPVDLGWRQSLIGQIARIARITCGTPSISTLYLSGIKNLFLYYMIKYEKTLEKGNNTAKIALWKAENHQEQWKEITQALSKCAAEVQPIMFTDDCGRIDSYFDVKGMVQPPKFVEEQLDEEFNTENGYLEPENVDIIIDGIWWMFSAAYARCYSHFYPNEDIILVFLQRFREDVITFFAERWKGVGELARQFEVIFGPISAFIEHDNLRACATSAFEYEGLAARSLVRPITVMVNNVPIRNYKTVSAVHHVEEGER